MAFACQAKPTYTLSLFTQPNLRHLSLDAFARLSEISRSPVSAGNRRLGEDVMSQASSADVFPNSGALSSQKSSPLLPILVGGFSAGTLDLLQACILFGWGIPRVIAAGFFGWQGIHRRAGPHAPREVPPFFFSFPPPRPYLP